MLYSSIWLATLLTVSTALPQAPSPYPPCNNSPALCDRSYSNITHLGAHDSPFVSNSANGFSISGNQFFNSTTQLDAGVRLLSLQIHWNNDTSQLHLCHTLCELYDAGTLVSWLTEIKQWMDRNPNDVVTLLLVNSANAAASQIASDYANSGIIKYAFAPLTKVKQPWPSLSTLITANTKLISFVASLSNNTGAPYLLNEFDNVFENPYQVTSPQNFSCLPDRPSALKGNTTAAEVSGRLFLMNHFLGNQQLLDIVTPAVEQAPNTNSADPSAPGSLGSAVQSCFEEYGRTPTFVLVDFFNVGPAIVTVDGFNNISSPIGRKQVTTSIVSDSTSVGGSSSSKRLAPLLLTVTVIMNIFLLS
jgi:hypothetical protein